METVVLKNKEKMIEVYKMVIEDSLPAISTAQTINASTTGKERVDAYMDQIKSGKMGYMAAIKNIRTMLENGISIEDLKIWSNMITDPKRVKKSMLLPFRFVDAWKSVKDLIEPKKLKTTKIKTAMQQELEKIFVASDEKAYEAVISINDKLFIVKHALERAFGLSASNTNILEEGEKIALLVDESKSMAGSNYYKQEESKNDPFFIAKVLSAAVKMNIPKSDCFFYTWADYCTERNITNESPFDFIEELHTRGGGTDVAAPLRKLIEDKKYVDKVIIFTDMQMYSYGKGIGTEIKNYIKKYRKMVNPNVKVLFWNLEGYGHMSGSGGAPIDFESTTNIFEVAGYSDSMLQIIPKLWTDKDYLIKAIEAIEL